MTHKSIDDLGELQKAIMETVWDLGEATARQVLERVSGDKNLAYTSVLSIIQRLEKYGWLKHRIDGRAYIYQPVIPREQEATRSLRQFIERVFHGNTQLLLQHLIEDEDFTPEDLQALKKMIDKKKRGNK